MAAGRTLRSLVSRRRRAEDEGEDEEGPVVVEDSQSEGSVLSEPDDDDGDGSSLGKPAEVETGATDAAQLTTTETPSVANAKKARKPRSKVAAKSEEHAEAPPPAPINFKTMADTQAMMTGLNIADQGGVPEAVDFESMELKGTDVAPNTGTNGHAISPVEKQRRDHEEYKKKRDSNPAFIPNRGNFFMHDTRGQLDGQVPPVRPAWQTRNRTRGGAAVGGPFSPANQMASAERAAEQPWKHDLHDTINEEPPAPPLIRKVTESVHTDQNSSARLFPKPVAPSNQAPPRVLSFSKATLVGRVQIRVFLAGNKAPVTFSEVPWKQYVRLPDHRPPLRRDKPVRVFLPGVDSRYIFPSLDRSFVFIPRQNRPNSFSSHRGNYQRSVGGYGYSSRRTSMYGGSIYSGSVAPSRRSSLAGISRENAFSPAASMSGMPPNRPFVRLPHGSQHYSAVSTPIGPLSGQQTPIGMHQLHSYPPPQQPAHYTASNTQVLQPRPRKLADIHGMESPMLGREPQPFQSQLPSHMHEPPPPYFSPQHMMAPPQPQAGTPLTGIPEQAIHAPAFQPPGYSQPQYYQPYPPQPPPQNYYYPPPSANGYAQMPMYMMPPQGYMAPPSAHSMPHPSPHVQAPPQPPPPPPEAQRSSQAQSGMVAHESNGMVFYVPASEAQQSEQYQPAESFVPSYAMPGLPPPTPPESSMPYYYPPMQPGMQEMGTAVYYPAQSQQ